MDEWLIESCFVKTPFGYQFDRDDLCVLVFHKDDWLAKVFKAGALVHVIQNDEGVVQKFLFKILQEL